MGESNETTRVFSLDAYTKLELTPAGTVMTLSGIPGAGGTGEQEGTVMYDAKLLVMGMTVFNVSAAASANVPLGVIALGFVRTFCMEREGQGLSATQKKWFETGTARRIDQMLSNVDRLRVDGS